MSLQTLLKIVKDTIFTGRIKTPYTTVEIEHPRETKTSHTTFRTKVLLLLSHNN